MTSKMSLKERLTVGFRYGAGIGAVTGILVAFLYVLVSPFVALIYSNLISGEPTPSVPLLPYIPYIAFILVIIYSIGCTIGGITGILVGILTGLVLGGLIAAYFEFFSIRKSIILGLIIGLSVAWILFMEMRGLMFYWLYVGWPSMIYIGFCVWMGKRIYNRMVLKLTEPIKEDFEYRL